MTGDGLMGRGFPSLPQLRPSYRAPTAYILRRSTESLGTTDEWLTDAGVIGSSG